MELTARPHYPLPVRLLISLFRAGELPNVATVRVEPVYGHAGRILYRDGRVRMLRGRCAGVNELGAAEIARDKGYTKFFLQELGYRTPRGRTFLLPSCIEQIEPALRRHGFNGFTRIETCHDYVTSEIGFPCFVKLNDGSLGRGVDRCEDERELRTVVAQHEAAGTGILLVEEAVDLPDHRVVVFGDRVVCCYRRAPLGVTGDGARTVAELLARKGEELLQRGRASDVRDDDPRIARTLERQGLSLESVPGSGQTVPLQEISNLSAGGEAVDLTHAICPRWRDLCVRVTGDVGLRLCGVDLACADITDPEAPYGILEINPSPGLDHFAALGERQRATVREMYRRIFNNEA